MEGKVIYLDSAKKDLHKAKCYFDFFEKGNLFLNDFETQIKFIVQFPYAFQIRYRDIRIIQLENFQYSIHYFVANNVIHIISILGQEQSF